MKKSLLLVLCIMFSIFANAYDFEVDGIYYYIPYPYNHAEVTNGDVKYSGTVTIPPTVTYDGKTYPVTVVGGFGDCVGLEKVVLGENVTIIDSRAFKNCTKLSSINWNDNIVEMRGECFWGCLGLTDVVISANRRVVGVDNFRDCQNIETVTIHDGATGIGQGEFTGCISLKAIDIPNSVLTIGVNAFLNCTNLVTAKIGDGVQEVTGFGGCSNLEKVVLGKNVTVIDSRAFKDCTKLSSINWNDNIVEMRGECFWGCLGLTDVVISANRRVAGVDNFRDCQNIKTVTIHDGATVIGQGEFSGCTSIKAIDIPNSVLTVSNNAFQGCENLVAAKIGDGVQEISYHVFSNCSRLEKIVMGAGIKSIGMRTFGGNCNQLSSITILSSQVPTLVADGFSNYNATVYVPSQSVSAYQAADYWKDFTSIKAYEDQVYLTIRQAEQGSVKMLTNVGERYSYDFLPAPGWVIHSVTFNNEDVTKQLIGNNYTTPAMTTSSTLSVVFEEESSAVRSTTARNVRVTTDDNKNIIISEVPYGETISIYSTNGTLLKQFSAESVRTSINMNTHGVYIVKVGNLNVKLSL